MSEQIEHIYDRLVAAEKLKSGTKYERLAAFVFQILDRASYVVHDVELRGPGKEAEHQIDVSVTDRSGQRRRIVVEARDRNKRVNLAQVRDFFGVVHQLAPDQAWIVSVTGFTADAETYARDEGIGLAVLRPAADGEDNRVKAIHFRMAMRAIDTPTITSWLAKDDNERMRLRAALAGREGETYAIDGVEESFYDKGGNRLASVSDVSARSSTASRLNSARTMALTNSTRSSTSTYSATELPSAASPTASTLYRRSASSLSAMPRASPSSSFAASKAPRQTPSTA